MTAARVLRIVRYHWMIIVVLTLLSALSAFAFALTQQRQYTAGADVFVAVTGSTTAGDLVQGSNFSQQQARNLSTVATRQVVLAPVITELGLDDTVAELRERVSTSVALNTSLISITATDPSPTAAARIANLVAAQLAEIGPTLSPQGDGLQPVLLRVVETAVAPTEPSAPKVPLLIALGALAGLALAAAVVALRLMIGTRVRSVEQARDAAGAALIGTVVSDRDAQQHPVTVRTAPHSLRAEDYRRLRGNLRFVQSSEQHRVFVFTSSLPGEGKSTTSANVAAALAATGISVCLVEADLRRPSLARVLDLAPEIGLTTVVAGDLDLDEAIMTWGPDRLHVLLAGPVPPNPSELLESARTRALLESLRDSHDVVIIDAPPVHPVADAAVLARHFGGAVLIVGAARVRERDVARAAERLRGVGATVHGIVVNFARATRADRLSYASYSVRDSVGPRRRRSASPEPLSSTPAPAGIDDAPSERARERTPRG